MHHETKTASESENESESENCVATGSENDGECYPKR